VWASFQECSICQSKSRQIPDVLSSIPLESYSVMLFHRRFHSVDSFCESAWCDSHESDRPEKTLKKLAAVG
jgi:hypothetical protein